jgi:hypothetical protein
MKTNRITKFHIAALTLLSSLVLHPSASLAQGSLTPPGAPGPTMRTLTQIEPRTPISAAPFTINVPGSYYLTTNLTVSTGDAITIAASGVTLDLNGFTICSTAPSETGYGIYLVNRRNITIANGFITGGVTNNGWGTYSGTGFRHGISAAYSGNVLVNKVSVSGCLHDGICLNIDYSTVVESCSVQTVGNLGIYATLVKTSAALDCGGTAIYGDQVSDSRGEASRSGYGIYAGTAQNCYGYSLTGYGVSAETTAQNCRGFSISGCGLFAYTAQNCWGQSATDSGLYALRTAQNCYGYSSDGYGLSARTAENCYGSSDTSTGLSVDIVQNSWGNAGGTGLGLYASQIAIGCYGYSSSGTGLRTFLANSCRGETATGTALNTIYRYNMP